MAHADISFNISGLGLSRSTDSYYLMLDDRFMPDFEDYFKVRCVLRIMLGESSRMTGTIDAGESFLFPIDLRDEYIGCIRFHRVNKTNLSISFGIVHDVGGWSRSPSGWSAWKPGTEDFRPGSNELKVDREDLLAAIAKLITSDFSDKDDKGQSGMLERIRAAIAAAMGRPWR